MTPSTQDARATGLVEREAVVAYLRQTARFCGPNKSVAAQTLRMMADRIAGGSHLAASTKDQPHDA